MKKIILAVLLLAGGGGIWYFGPYQKALADRRIAECGGFANGRTITATETTRLFVNVPRDIYPSPTIEPHSGTMGYVSNGGPYGEAMGSQGKPNCWSTYFEFGGKGSVDLTAKSAKSGIKDYVVHFNVTPR